MRFKQNDVLQEFVRLRHLIDEFYHEIAMKQGLSDSAYSILQAILVLGDGCTQTEICKYTCLNKQTVNSSVKKLKQDGIIEFQSGNGREMKIHLTTNGEVLVDEKVLPIERAESEIFDEMTIEEQRQILRLTEKYLESFRGKVKNILDKNKE